MKITPQALQENGWIPAHEFTFYKDLCLGLWLWFTEDMKLYLATATSDTELPNITTLEQLALLETLLSDAPAPAFAAEGVGT